MPNRPSLRTLPLLAGLLLGGCHEGSVVVAASATGAGGGTSTSTTSTATTGAGGAGDTSKLWSQRFGDAEAEWPMAVVVSPGGAVAVSGSFEGTIDFGSGPLVYGGAAFGCFVAVFDAAGHPRWSRMLATSADGYVLAPVLAFSGEDLVAAGTFTTTLDLGGAPLESAGSSDVFVAKFDTAGDPLWSRRFGDDDRQYTTSVAVDPAGNILVAGKFAGTLQFGNDALSGGAMFLAKLDATGQPLVARGFDAEGPPFVGVDAGGNVVLAGNMSGSVDFGLGPLVSGGSVDLFVARFDPALNPLFSRRFGDASSQTLGFAAVDPQGDVLLGGRSEGGLDFGSGPLFAVGETGQFIAKLDSEAKVVWTRTQVPTVGYRALALDAEGRTVMARSDMFLETIDAAGQTLGVRSLSGAALVEAVAATPTGEIVVTGLLEGSVDFGFGSISPEGSSGLADVFVASLPFP